MGGSIASPRDLLIPRLNYREIFYIEQRFFTSALEKITDLNKILVKKSN